ncbi:MAG: hypothetical protein V8S99_00315 [Oscillospiraceae bacterium]
MPTISPSRRTMLERHLEAFRSIPAAKSVHHSFLSGLLMHTSNMLRLADYLSGLYAGIIDRSLLLTGTLLHDFAKEREFCVLRARHGHGLFALRPADRPSGHGRAGGGSSAREALGICRRKRACCCSTSILSHHGEPEFGAAVRPMCAEAELLSLDRPGRQPHGDLRRGAAGAAGGHVLRP